MSGKNLLTTFNENEISFNDIVSLNMGYKKRTGEQFAKATLSDGTTRIKSFYDTGVTEDSIISIPSYSSKEERNRIIEQLSTKYTQDDIADMLDISQSTVSNALSKKKKKK